VEPFQSGGYTLAHLRRSNGKWVHVGPEYAPTRERSEKAIHGILYVALVGDLVKIGITLDAERRWRQLQTALASCDGADEGSSLALTVDLREYVLVDGEVGGSSS
jgi:hypothetical protein